VPVIFFENQRHNPFSVGSMTDLATVSTGIHTLLNQSVAEGVLDDQFLQLLQLQDESNPDFVSEVVELYFEDSSSKIEQLRARLADEEVDFNIIDQIVHQFKGSSASFGAQAMATICVHLREAGHANNAVACRELTSQLADSFAGLKARLDQFLLLEERRKALCSGG
jgi:histidine-containing phosphotransfer peotein